MADDEALFQKGMPIRREVLGPQYVDASMARADEFMMSFQRATTTWAWGWAWGDDTLDRKTRSLMNLAMLTALNRAPEIKLHVKGALNNGVTVDEIKAALLHATAETIKEAVSEQRTTTNGERRRMARAYQPALAALKSSVTPPFPYKWIRRPRAARP